MTLHTVVNSSTNTTIADKVILADTFLSRLTGLLGRKHLSPGEGLIITACKSIHMVFMKFAIDVVFLDKNNRVVGLVENIKPFQFSPVFFKANCAVELPSGSIAQYNVQSGHTFQITKNK